MLTINGQASQVKDRLIEVENSADTAATIDVKNIGFKNKKRFYEKN